MKRPNKVGIIGGSILVCFVLLIFLWFPSEAGSYDAAFGGENGVLSPSGSLTKRMRIAQQDEPVFPPNDQACKQCHQDSEREVVFESGESLPVQVDLGELDQSAHGVHDGAGLGCTDCHEPADYVFPHEPVTEESQRAYKIDQSAACERCHQQPHLTGHPDRGSENPVICTDCHGSHDALTVAQMRAGEAGETCASCHVERGIALADPHILTDILRKGMFADSVDKQYCLSCHSQEGLTLTFANGDEISLTIDSDDFDESVHGASNPWQPLDCVDCHGRYSFPHEPIAETNDREYTLARYTNCAKCHERHYEQTMDSVHEEALEAGNLEAAVCTDCHGAHDTPPPDEPRERISHTCQQCHSTIFDDYASSIHGEALIEDSNPDVPVCIDCHGVHDINDPTTALARRRSPELCAECHADDELMTRYGISTDVFETYVADFHGETITLFEHEDPSVEANTAVCYDCHGVHSIRPVDDPENGIKANLLETCRQCHPDANENFPDAWTSHYQPSLEHNPMVYLVDTFYKAIIPVTLVGLTFLVATDVFRRIRKRVRR